MLVPGFFSTSCLLQAFALSRRINSTTHLTNDQFTEFVTKNPAWKRFSVILNQPFCVGLTASYPELSGHYIQLPYQSCLKGSRLPEHSTLNRCFCFCYFPFFGKKVIAPCNISPGIFSLSAHSKIVAEYSHLHNRLSIPSRLGKMTKELLRWEDSPGLGESRFCRDLCILRSLTFPRAPLPQVPDSLEQPKSQTHLLPQACGGMSIVPPALLQDR